MNNFHNAKWIAASKNENAPAPLFRKDFYIEKDIEKSTMFVCGLGYGVYYINGKLVTDDVLTTPVTKYDTTVLYNKYDITNHIKKGTNTVGAMLGNGCYCVTYPRWDTFKPPWLHHPKLIMCLKNEFADGSIQYDASHLDNAFVCRSPGGIMKETAHPPIRVIKEIIPIKISDNVYDLGQNISGWIKIKASGKCGQEITFRYAELLNDDKTINPEELNTIIGSQTHCDKYILKGCKNETWSPHFAYHGFRYVEVTNAPQDFEITGQVVHTDLKIISEFECSDEMLNKIHMASRWSTLTNMHGFPTDCPQREQNAWTGDALLSADQTLINYDSVSLYKKWLGDIRDSQRPSGQISCISTTGGWGYNWGTGPAWDSALIHIPYLIYKYHNDISAIKENWTSMKLYMDFMDSMAEDYIVNYGLGDWLTPKETDVCPNIITDTCYYSKNYEIMAKCAELLNENADEYTKKSLKIKKAFRDKFLSNDLFLKNRQTAIAAAIYFDMYTEEEKKKAVKRLTDIIRNNKNRFDTGILGTKYMFTALCENGHCDLMYKMVTNPKMPSYAYWINHGMTTLCEYWDMSHSCNHHMYSEVDMWLYKYIAGIQINEEKIIINPCFISEVKWVKANHKNVYVEWDSEKISVKSDKKTILHINGKAYVLLPGEHTIQR